MTQIVGQHLNRKHTHSHTRISTRAACANLLSPILILVETNGTHVQTEKYTQYVPLVFHLKQILHHLQVCTIVHVLLVCVCV